MARATHRNARHDRAPHSTKAGSAGTAGNLNPADARGRRDIPIERWRGITEVRYRLISGCRTDLVAPARHGAPWWFLSKRFASPVLDAAGGTLPRLPPRSVRGRRGERVGAVARSPAVRVRRARRDRRPGPLCGRGGCHRDRLRAEAPRQRSLHRGKSQCQRAGLRIAPGAANRIAVIHRRGGRHGAAIELGTIVPPGRPIGSDHGEVTQPPIGRSRGEPSWPAAGCGRCRRPSPPRGRCGANDPSRRSRAARPRTAGAIPPRLDLTR